jgi:hypothetical protein
MPDYHVDAKEKLHLTEKLAVVTVLQHMKTNSPLEYKLNQH